ncbi:MAG: ATP-binding protein [Deltaproteobacteria bacterium]|nr:ATP-binding protein [Deltaproteobacteria bacterium]
MPEAQPAKRRKRNDWSRFIVQHTPGGVITTDAQGRITEFNPAAEKLTGYRREEALGQPMDRILICEGAEGGSLLERVRRGMAEETEELVLRKRTGDKVPVMVSSFALRDRQMELLGVAVILRDLTMVKRLETERRHLVNMFAHDLKTPVVGMAGLIRRLVQGKAGPLTQEQKNYLVIVHREMSRLEKLITSFLEFARLDLRLLIPHPEVIQVTQECREVIALLAPLAEAKGMRLETSFPPNLPPLRVDPLLFRRLLENLLGNAIKFSPPGTTVLLKVWQEKRELGFAVKDQGPGIPPEELSHLFQFFYRGKAGGGQEGFGLGLATVKRIVDSQGGRLWVDSAPGQGSTFNFTLPIEQ